MLIGRFAKRGEAAQFLERLRKSGYEDLRIISEPKAAGTNASESQADTNARAAKYKAQPSNSSTARSSVKHHRPIQLVALAADKVAAASEAVLVTHQPASRPRPDSKQTINRRLSMK